MCGCAAGSSDPTRTQQRLANDVIIGCYLKKFFFFTSAAARSSETVGEAQEVTLTLGRCVLL